MVGHASAACAIYCRWVALGICPLHLLLLLLVKHHDAESLGPQTAPSGDIEVMCRETLQGQASRRLRHTVRPLDSQCHAFHEGDLKAQLLMIAHTLTQTAVPAGK